MYRLSHSGYVKSVFIFLRPDKTSQGYFISYVVESDILFPCFTFAFPYSVPNLKQFVCNINKARQMIFVDMKSS
jgi:hypothetical protein